MRKQKDSVTSIFHDDGKNVFGATPTLALFVDQDEKTTRVLQRLCALGYEIVSPEAAAQAGALVIGAGDGARDAMRFAAHNNAARLALLNPSATSLWALPRGLNMPSLVLMDYAATPSQRLMGQLAAWQLRRQNERSALHYAPSPALRDAALLEWMMSGRLVDQRAKPASFVSIARRVATGAAVGAMALSPVAAVAKTAAAPAPAPAASTQNSFDAMFSDGMTLNSAQVKGDGYTVPASRARAGNPPPIKTKEKTKKKNHPVPEGGITIGSDQIRGDGYSPESLQGTGGIQIVDAHGLKYFINTNITFSTSSSASGAASEASFTAAVNASTTGGGVVATTLNDAFDGYNGLCVDVNTAGTADCQTGTAGITMYTKNGPASMDTSCTSGGQVLFPTKIISGVEVSRKVYVPWNDEFIRWLNIFHNPTASPISIRMATSNNLGSDGGTIIVNASSGLPVSTSSQWVTTFQNFSGNASSDLRLGHVLQGGGALVTPLSGLVFANGDDNPYWWYVITLAPGETQIIANFATGQGTKALAASKSADIVTQMDTPGSHAQACITPAERAEITNFTLADPTPTPTPTPTLTPTSTPTSTPTPTATPGNTAIELAYFGAKNVCENVEVRWETLSEIGAAGYQVYRGEGNAFAAASLLSENLIAANGSGGSYQFVDEAVKAGKTYTYWLVEVEHDGSQKVRASASVTAEGCALSH
ncbi:MAG TPA: hypothetical protein PLJ62_12000 [Thermoflexales bacterium]|nr:hypothetical protein [Thermoflexales bacterium]